MMLHMIVAIMGINCMLLCIFLRVRRLVRMRSGIHLVAKLKVLRLELLDIASTNHFTESEAAWLPPLRQIIDSAILFLDKCNNHGIHTLGALKKSLAPPAFMLNKSQDRAFAAFVKNAIPLLPFPEDRNFPSAVELIQTRYNSIINEAKRCHSPLIKFSNDYLRISCAFAKQDKMDLTYLALYMILLPVILFELVFFGIKPEEIRNYKMGFNDPKNKSPGD